MRKIIVLFYVYHCADRLLYCNQLFSTALCHALNITVFCALCLIIDGAAQYCVTLSMPVCSLISVFVLIMWHSTVSLAFWLGIYDIEQHCISYSMSLCCMLTVLEYMMCHRIVSLASFHCVACLMYWNRLCSTSLCCSIYVTVLLYTCLGIDYSSHHCFTCYLPLYWPLALLVLMMRHSTVSLYWFHCVSHYWYFMELMVPLL